MTATTRLQVYEQMLKYLDATPDYDKGLCWLVLNAYEDCEYERNNIQYDSTPAEYLGCYPELVNRKPANAYVYSEGYWWPKTPAFIPIRREAILTAIREVEPLVAIENRVRTYNQIIKNYEYFINTGKRYCTGLCTCLSIHHNGEKRPYNIITLYPEIMVQRPFMNNFDEFWWPDKGKRAFKVRIRILKRAIRMINDNYKPWPITVFLRKFFKY